MAENKIDLDALVQERLEADTEFASSLEEMSDEDKDSALAEKKNAIIVDELEKGKKNEELANNYKVRAEKAEKQPQKVDPKPIETPGMAVEDIAFIGKADIHMDDLTDVINEAKLKGITVREAHEFMKPILDVREEQRTTAAATETKSPRGVKPKTGEDYLKKAEETGEIPEADAEMQKMILARQDRNRKK